MPYAVGINENTLDLVATNNGGIKPLIEKSPYPNCAGSYFVLQDDPNLPALIVSVDYFFETYHFIGPESDTEFRPIQRLA